MGLIEMFKNALIAILPNNRIVLNCIAGRGTVVSNDVTEGKMW